MPAGQMQTRLRISASVNTLNEEGNLRFCLQTLTWCDEIVVVDMHSDDSTVAIAREFTDKIFLHERTGFVEPARAFAVDQCTGDWVLIVDADEMVPYTLSESLTSIAMNDVADVVAIPRKNLLLGEWIRHTGWWPDYQLRYFKAGRLAFSERIHSVPEATPDARTMMLPAAEESSLVHFNFLNMRDLIDRVNSYSSIEAEQMWNEGKRFEWGSAVRESLDEFKRRLFEEGGLNDGARGILLGTAMGFYKFLNWAKLWELENNPAPGERYMQYRQALLREWKEQRKM